MTMYFQTLSFTLCLGISYFTLFIVWRYATSPLRKIPGPWITRWSRLWFFRRVQLGSFHLDNIALHEKYGPVVRIAPNFVSISTPEKSLYGHGAKAPKGDWYLSWKHPSPKQWSLFPEQDMKRHADTRKRFQAMYSMSSLVSYEGYVDECIDIFMKKLDEASTTRSTMNMVHWFQCYAFDVMGEITYSERFGFLDKGDDIANTMAAIDKVLPYGTLSGIYPKSHPILYRILQKIPGSGPAGFSYLMGFVQRKMDERNQSERWKSRSSKTQDHDSPEDFLEKMMRAHREKPDKVTQYHIFIMGLSNIIAGSDTTAISLSSVLYYLIITPGAIAKLRQEICDKGLDSRRITFKDSQGMPYLQAVLKEGLRMHPATGLPLWRVVPEGGIQINDNFIPAGTNVGLNSWVAQYDTSVYGPDAHQFRPERWLEAAEYGEDRLKQMEAYFIPFGLGSRTCIGRHISMLEMAKLIPEIVKAFDPQLAMPKEQWTTTNYWFVKPDKLPVLFSRRT